jgi:hypothetical protein
MAPAQKSPASALRFFMAVFYSNFMELAACKPQHVIFVTEMTSIYCNNFFMQHRPMAWG